jgi:hypothetical protein
MAENDKILSLDEIEQVDDPDYLTVLVPQWKGTARFGTISAEEMFKFFEENDVVPDTDKMGKRLVGVRLLAKSFVGPDNKRVDYDKAIKIFKTKNSGVIAMLAERVMVLNGLNKKDAAEIAKNVSGEAPSGASPSDSPETPATV